MKPTAEASSCRLFVSRLFFFVTVAASSSSSCDLFWKLAVSPRSSGALDGLNLDSCIWISFRAVCVRNIPDAGQSLRSSRSVADRPGPL